MKNKVIINSETYVNGDILDSKREARGEFSANKLKQYLMEAGAEVKEQDLIVKTTIVTLKQGTIKLVYSFTDANESEKMNDALSDSDEPITKEFK